MKFDYNGELISTTDDLRISVADLRDLVNAVGLTDKYVALQEVGTVLRCIEKKNRLPLNSLSIL